MEQNRLADIFIIGGYLTIIGLRIFNVINWSWLWILCPFWIAAVGAIIGSIIGLFIGISINIYEKIKRGKRNEGYKNV